MVVVANQITVVVFFSPVFFLVYLVWFMASWLLLQPTPAAQRIGYDIMMKAKRDFFPWLVSRELLYFSVVWWFVEQTRRRKKSYSLLIKV